MVKIHREEDVGQLKKKKTHHKLHVGVNSHISMDVGGPVLIYTSIDVPCIPELSFLLYLKCISGKKIQKPPNGHTPSVT